MMILFITKRNYTYDIYVYVKKKLKQAWSMTPPISPKRTTNSYPKSLKTNMATIYSSALDSQKEVAG